MPLIINMKKHENIIHVNNVKTNFNPLLCILLKDENIELNIISGTMNINVSLNITLTVYKPISILIDMYGSNKTVSIIDIANLDGSELNNRFENLSIS